jgi:hypothetical protein
MQNNADRNWWYGSQGSNEMRVYTQLPLKKSIFWELYNRNTKLVALRETPAIITMDDGLQYARLIGASKQLIPMAQTMPSSLAATLGFIDEEYALLALEEDVLDETLTARYINSGVPTLNEEDIFPDLEEKAEVPLEEWLEYNDHGESASGINKKPKHAPLPEGITFSIKNGMLIIEVDRFRIKDRENLKIVLYDLSGRVIQQWDYADIAVTGHLTCSLYEHGLSSGIFILNINGGKTKFSERIFIQ